MKITIVIEDRPDGKTSTEFTWNPPLNIKDEEHWTYATLLAMKTFQFLKEQDGLKEQHYLTKDRE